MTGLRLAPFLAAAAAAALLAGCAPAPGRDAVGKGEAPAIRVLLVGDTSFGENYQRDVKAGGGVDILERRGYDYPLSRVKPLLAGADLVVANLETPLTAPGQSALAGRKQYVHWSDPEKAPAALVRHNIKAACLANNHAMDYGKAGLESTLAALARHGIGHYGAGGDEAAAEGPLRVELGAGAGKVRLAFLGGFEHHAVYDEDYRFYARGEQPGVRRLDLDRLCADIDRLRRDEPGTFVVVTPHWGRDYGAVRREQVDGAHRLVDAGADLVAGSGAHHFQSAELYRGRWVLYNLGNFVFNSPGRYARARSHGMSLAAELRFPADGRGGAPRLRLYPLLSDNLRTGYRPAPAGAGDIAEAREALERGRVGGKDFAARARDGRDGFGRYFELGPAVVAEPRPAEVAP
jgi:poly-gamma-glutamate capsule biosynthesis protein CapA/YwtB (metallophosphatase superfamily)